MTPKKICKATLKLSLSEKEASGSSSSSDTEAEKSRVLRWRHKKKQLKKKKPIQDYSDSEIESRVSKKIISVFDLIPGDNLRSDICTGRPRPQPRIITEKKCHTTRQLAEVQAKLFTLKNKLWFGTGNGDSPIAWGKSSISPKKKKNITKKKKKQEKMEKSKETKSKMDQNDKTTKNQNGLRRQVAVDYPSQSKKMSMVKSKSLPETPSEELVQYKNKPAVSGDEEKQEKKKKKKRGKFVKKAKVISNAKQFTRKD